MLPPEGRPLPDHVLSSCAAAPRPLPASGIKALAKRSADLTPSTRLSEATPCLSLGGCSAGPPGRSCPQGRGQRPRPVSARPVGVPQAPGRAELHRRRYGRVHLKAGPRTPPAGQEGPSQPLSHGATETQDPFFLSKNNFSLENKVKSKRVPKHRS